MEIHLIDFR